MNRFLKRAFVPPEPSDLRRLLGAAAEDAACHLAESPAGSLRARGTREDQAFPS